jgi:hypothetical protein
MLPSVVLILTAIFLRGRTMLFNWIDLLFTLTIAKVFLKVAQGCQQQNRARYLFITLFIPYNNYKIIEVSGIQKLFVYSPLNRAG